MAKKKLSVDENGEMNEQVMKHFPYMDPSSIGDVEIIEAHLTGPSCSFNYLEMVQEGSNRKMGSDDPRFVHEDLINAFKKLNNHLAVICEGVTLPVSIDIDDIEDYDPNQHKQKDIEYKLSRFKCTGFKVKGKAENKSVILFGYKLLSTDKKLKLETPPQNYEGGDHVFLPELVSAMHTVIKEVDEYRTGKIAPHFVQSSIDFSQRKEDDLPEGTDENV